MMKEQPHNELIDDLAAIGDAVRDIERQSSPVAATSISASLSLEARPHAMGNPHQEIVCENEHCIFCVGGIEICEICNGTESELPTHCPGEKITSEQGEKITAMRLDFRDGQWVELWK